MGFEHSNHSSRCGLQPWTRDKSLVCGERVRPAAVRLYSALAAAALAAMGCAAPQRATDPISPAPPLHREFTVRAADLKGRTYDPGTAETPADHVAGAVLAWGLGTSVGFIEAGDALVRAYDEGKRLGWLWEPRTSGVLLGHALRAYHAGGRVDLQDPVARALAEELREQPGLVPMNVRILAFWATGEQAFATSVPPTVRLGLTRGGSR